MANNIIEQTATLLTPESLKAHWQGHRGLSRRILDAFPEKELFEFSIGGMRPYALLALEMIDLAEGGVKGLATGDWTMGDGAPRHYGQSDNGIKTKAELLALWDKVTADIERYYPEIAPERWQQVEKAFGMYENKGIGTLQYLIDNEIHHRGQGYVYLRALGIEPAPFWDRQ
ncbi:DinB family protein [Chitinophaga sedimenti]|uniref:DinB family protein n=1 Tax=Chitinophaga sedimenti TaxID=2033606 RepID=UPI0020061A1B|nr:DinB family protein [Chitinophaga sedimenti]MCK7554256.1 DinB family protein [Chitinophaga sedimenti]